MNTDSFEKDLKAGLVVENNVLALLQKKYPCATLVNAHKGYDIWIPELHKSVEVKSDQKSQYTGNMVIEVWMYGKQSGLLSSTADWWVFYDGLVYVAMDRMKIFECILLNKLIHTEFIGKGDTQSKKAFLIKKDLLFSYGKELGK